MGQLKLSELYVGKIDGYNEFLEYGQDTCRELFFEYPNFDAKKILNGSVYYICGDKGTGKTMLLKYMESLVNEKGSDSFSAFIRFKKDVDEEQRNQIKRASIYEEVVENEMVGDSTLNCILAWQVYLIKVIVNRLEKNTEGGVFKRDSKEWQALYKLLDAIYNEPSDCNGIKKILPRIKKGNIELSFRQIAKLDLDLEWASEEKNTVTFSSAARKVVDLYSRLSPDSGQMYIFVDELELSLKQTKRYERDTALIRDLIFAIQYLNEIAKENGFQVYVITALRNEVYNEVRSKGLEINKPIHDFGIQITWQQKGGDIRNHPLLKMLERRFQYSEKKAGLAPSPDIFTEYFVKTVGRSEVPICNYIIDQTWLRPRDLIRFFSIIQQLAGDKTFIDQEILDAVKQRYSEESWNEFEEILSVKYSDKEITGIRYALTSIQVPFTGKSFIAQIDGKADTFEEVELLKKGGRQPNHILKDLYDIGVIGNYGRVARFSFKGDKDIDPMETLTFHYPLMRFFKAKRVTEGKKIEAYD